MKRKRVLLSWSGGKDSALALQALRADPNIEVAALLTSVTREYERISVHGVRRSLLERQAELLRLPLFTIELDPVTTNDAYESAFLSALERIRRDLPGVTTIAFGDLFLADVRAYRERLLAPTGFTPLFPIWGLDTADLARRFIRDGFAARLVCVDTTQLDGSFANRAFDDSFLAELPPTVDPCGERGEFHTFVSDGPGYDAPVQYTVGETVLRDQRFAYCDLIPVDSRMRIVSFLPAATEITYALGAGADLVGRSHECDYPPQVRSLPVVSKPALPLDGLSQNEIDRAVAAHLATGESLYQVDEVLLDELHPDIVFTQDLCQVCAPSGNELSRALRDMSHPPQVLSLTPRNLAEIAENIVAIGAATGRDEAARELVLQSQDRIHRVIAAVADASPRCVSFLEWTEPLFCAGHWVPEMVLAAGGEDPLGQVGADSQRMTWDDVAASQPEMIIVAPCGYGLKEAIEVANRLPRVVEAQIYAVDANAYFARPGPRVAEGIELLAHLFHPERFAWPHQHQPWARIA